MKNVRAVLNFYSLLQPGTDFSVEDYKENSFPAICLICYVVLLSLVRRECLMPFWNVLPLLITTVLGFCFIVYVISLICCCAISLCLILPLIHAHFQAWETDYTNFEGPHYHKCCYVSLSFFTGLHKHFAFWFPVVLGSKKQDPPRSRLNFLKSDLIPCYLFLLSLKHILFIVNVISQIGCCVILPCLILPLIYVHLQA